MATGSATDSRSTSTIRKSSFSCSARFKRSWILLIGVPFVSLLCLGSSLSRPERSQAIAKTGCFSRLAREDPGHPAEHLLVQARQYVALIAQGLVPHLQKYSQSKPQCQATA